MIYISDDDDDGDGVRGQDFALGVTQYVVAKQLSAEFHGSDGDEEDEVVNEILLLEELLQMNYSKFHARLRLLNCLRHISVACLL
ncbi:unnamed protein product [Rodentolepis nana]|uniref:Protein kinase domain-containing protein n=1 Tax=Rodentolepis nana TaxID=102285 RepID=A0A0R3TE18_RODNA|nr:unnamed protein product [Rodentolepis nana]